VGERRTGSLTPTCGQVARIVKVTDPAGRSAADDTRECPRGCWATGPRCSMAGGAGAGKMAAGPVARVVVKSSPGAPDR